MGLGGAVSGIQNSWANCRQAVSTVQRQGQDRPPPGWSLPLPEAGFPPWLRAQGPPWAPQTPLLSVPPRKPHCSGRGGHCDGTSLTAQARERNPGPSLFSELKLKPMVYLLST